MQSVKDNFECSLLRGKMKSKRKGTLKRRLRRLNIRRAFSSTILVMLAAVLLTAQPLSYAFLNDQPAALVLGQSGFTSSTTTTSQTGLHGPFDLGFDFHGNLWVADSANNRVLEYTCAATGSCSKGNPATLVLGQSDFTSNAHAPSQTGLYSPQGLTFDSHGNLWVADYDNNRVLEYVPGTPPCSSGQFCNDMPAELVLGQSGFMSGGSATTQTGLFSPFGLSFDSHGNLWVADSANNRVLEYTCTATSICVDGNAAALELGQPSGADAFITNTPATSQTGLNGPFDLGYDPYGNLWVVDYSNSRVLEYTCTATSNCVDGNAAALVLGQSDFITIGHATSQTGLYYPEGLGFDSQGNLWVGDEGNNRVLEYTCAATGSCSKGNPATLVLGQSGFTSNTEATSQTGLYNPVGLSFGSHGNLWVADWHNNRVLEYPPPSYPLASVTVTAPANSTAITGTYVPIKVNVVTSPTSFEEYANLSVFVNSTTQVCPLKNSTSSGLYSCTYQVETAGTYEVNVTATITLPSGSVSLSSGNYYFTTGPVVQQIELVQGWNLISTPITPANTAIGTVLASQIAGEEFTVIWSYQGGKWLEATLSRGKLTGTLTAIKDGYGYWIYMTMEETLYITGNVIPPPPASPPSYPLNMGWNLVGFTPEPTVGSEATSTYLSSLGGNYNRVYLYSAGTWTENPTDLTPGQAVWIYVTAPATLRP